MLGLKADAGARDSYREKASLGDVARLDRGSDAEAGVHALGHIEEAFLRGVVRSGAGGEDLANGKLIVARSSHGAARLLEDEIHCGLGETGDSVAIVASLDGVVRAASGQGLGDGCGGRRGGGMLATTYHEGVIRCEVGWARPPTLSHLVKRHAPCRGNFAAPFS
jgi:hypothetical protein